MRRNLITALGLTATLIAGLLLPTAATAAAKDYEIQVEPTTIKTRDGQIYAEIAHPVSQGKIVKGPVILTYSPYSVLGRTSGRTRWVPKGYHVVFADVVGTGNSGGCYDYGGDREKRTGHDLVEWLGTQKWSTGKVGMIGGSYNGTTQHAAAVMHPPHLTTIIPEAAIARWYDYAYRGGIRYLLNNEAPSDEGVDTPLAFDFGFAIPPPVDVEDPAWADKVASTITPCDELDHTTHGYDDTPDYDKFWIERDYERLAHTVKIPVLIAHNWGDFNVKQANGWDMFNAYPNAKMFFGDRYSGHGVPDGDYAKTVDAWFDHYLMGVDNGIEKLPKITSETSNYEGALKYFSANKVKTTPVSLIAQSVPKTNPEDYGSKLLPTKPITGLIDIAEPSFPSAGINTESHSNHHARNNHDWWWFESPAFKKDTRIFGEIKVQLYLETQREWVTLAPTIVDIDMDCHVYPAGQHVANPSCSPRNLHSITRGFLDTRYRDGLEKQVPLKPGPFQVTVPQTPIDYVIKKNHHLGLNFSTEIAEWMIPKPYPCVTASDPVACQYVTIHVDAGRTRVILPIVGKVGDPNDLFDFSHRH